MITAITIRNEDEFNKVNAKLIEGGIRVNSSYMDDDYSFLLVTGNTAYFYCGLWDCEKVISAPEFLHPDSDFSFLDCWHKPEPKPIPELTLAEVCDKLGYEVKIRKETKND